MGRQAKIKKGLIQRRRGKKVKNIKKELIQIAQTNQSDYEQEMLELVQEKTEAELLETLDWVYVTADEKMVYGKLETIIKELGLEDRLQECLSKGFIEFKKVFDDDGMLLYCHRIQYSPNLDKLFCDGCWED